MSQKYLVQVVDDLDGAELEAGDADQVLFGVDGSDYVIDLSRTHAATLRSTLRRYADAARRDQQTVGKKAAATSRKPVQADPVAVRAWARTNGYTVSARGRVPEEIVKAYETTR